MKHYKEKHCKKLEHKLWEEDLVLQMCHGELTKFQSLRKSSSRRAMATSTALTIVKPPNLTTTSCTRLLVLMVESKMQEVLASSPSSRMTQPSRKTRKSSLRAESPIQSPFTMQTLPNSSLQMIKRKLMLVTSSLPFRMR